MPERLPAQPQSDGPPEECANCGTAIPRSAKACPDCGADERTGWRETTVYDQVDLPDEAIGGSGPGSRRRGAAHGVNGVAWYWWCVGIGLVVLLALGALALR